MFRNYYKAINDDIKTNRKLIDVIFKKTEKRSVRKTYRFFPGYGTAILAVLVLVITAVSYPTLMNNDKPQMAAESVSEKDEASAAQTKAFMPESKMLEMPESTEKSVKLSLLSEATKEEIALAERHLKGRFGEYDKETKHLFIFEIVGKFEAEDRIFYAGRWKWLVNNDHSSLLTEFVLNAEMTEMYECIYSDEETLSWSEENNLFE